MTNVTSKTTATLTLATLLTCSASLISAAWWARGVLEEQATATRRLEAKIDALAEQFATARREEWTFRDQNSWAGRLRWENRTLDLTVPEPRDWRDWRTTATK